MLRNSSVGSSSVSILCLFVELSVDLGLDHDSTSPKTKTATMGLADAFLSFVLSFPLDRLQILSHLKTKLSFHIPTKSH
jgi:hypothetical protein